MKIYEIYDEENNISVGALLYYEKERSCIIELCDGLDEWSAPLLFTSLVHRKEHTVLREISYLWVKERVIPSGRQNIESILKNHKLKEYREMDLLELAEGRCAQDSLCIRRLDHMPGYVRERAKKNIIECFFTENDKLLCFFADDSVKKVALNGFSEIDNFDKVLEDKRIRESVKVGTGGYSVIFDDSIEIPAWMLYEAGEAVPLSLKDFKMFAQNNIVDASEACDILKCSRQNLSYMVKAGDLNPVKANVKGNLYLKGDVIENMW